MTDDGPSALERRALARVGTTLRGKWRLDRLLGVGGMASVYSATHRNGKRGAVKMLHSELSFDAEVRSRFLREGYVANKVDHPGAVSVLDDDVTEDGSVFLVMELLEGSSVESLRAARPGGRLSCGEVVSMAVALLETLAAAHAKGVVHRDLKPDNLFLTSTGQLKVLDFGIARLREGTETGHRTRTGVMMGTPVFMAPEQALGNWDQVDQRTDLWAVGATMFTLLTGRVVHEADTVNKQLLAAMTHKAVPIATVMPDIPMWLGAVVDRALAFDRKDRWPTARAMQQQLAAHDSGLAPGIPLPSRAPDPVLAAAPLEVEITAAYAPDHGTAAPVSADPELDVRTRKLPARRIGPAAVAVGVGAVAGIAAVAVMFVVLGRVRPSASAGALPESAPIGAAASSPSQSDRSSSVPVSPAPSAAELPTVSATASSRPPDKTRGARSAPTASKSADPLGRY